MINLVLDPERNKVEEEAKENSVVKIFEDICPLCRTSDILVLEFW